MKAFKIIISILVALIILSALSFYFILIAPNTKEKAILLIPTDASYQQVIDSLEEGELLTRISSFKLAAKLLSYDKDIKSGRYAIDSNLNNKEVLKLLIRGKQEPVRFQFQNIRLKEDFAGLIGRTFETDSSSFSSLLSDSTVAKNYGFTTENFYTMFIPNTYEIYWNTNAKNLLERFHKEYQTFWDANRRAKADSLGFTTAEVSILASIVQGEAMHRDEMPAIAGLYINRLNQGMLLQADPTVIFAQQDFSIRRVLHKHLEIESPYNTYKFKGLPPGPINMPSIAAIDAVLNHQKHAYIYMCAKDDFSGYHLFAETWSEHIKNARKFQRALDLRNIK